LAEDVEISNVGGPRPRDGVASEATLQALLAATERRGGGGGPDTATRIQENYNKAQKDGTDKVSKLGKAAEAAGKGLKGFAKELAFGGTRASDFAEAIFGSTNVVTRLTRYLDHTVDQFRSLASVGASFENSIFEMMKISAEASMSLDDFAQMVRDNAANLAFFGGTVTNGAKLLGTFSQEFRTGLGRQFFAMGFTIEDVNEGLIDFLSNERMRQSQALRFDGQTQASAANYILQLDRLAKLTGEERRQLADRMAQQMTEARIRNQLNRLNENERNNLRGALTFFDTRLPGFSDGFQDLMDGVAQTDLGKALVQAMPGIETYMQRVFTGEEELSDVISTLQNRFGPTLERFSQQYGPAQLTSMQNSSNGVVAALASVADYAYQFNSIRGIDAGLSEEEQGRRNRLTSALGNFEQAITDVRKSVVRAFFEIVDGTDGRGGLLEVFGEFGDALKNFFSPGAAGGLSTVTNTVKDFLNAIFGPQGFVTRGLRRFNDFLNSGEARDALGYLQEKLVEFANYLESIFTDQDGKLTIIEGLKTLLRDTFANIMDFAFGELQQGPNGEQSRSGGMFDSIKQSIAGFFSGTEFGKAITDSITNAFNTVDTHLSKILGMPQGTTVSDWLTTQLTAIRNAFNGPDGVLSKVTTLYDDIKVFVTTQVTAIENAFNGPDGILSKITTLYNDIKGFIGTSGQTSLTQWFDNTLATISNMIDTVTTTMNSTVNYFRDALGFGQGQTLREWFDSTWTSISNTMNAINNTIITVMDTIADTFGFAPGGQTFQEWMNTTLTDLQTKMQTFINTQINAVRDLLGMEATEDFASYIDRLIQEMTISIEAGMMQILKSLGQYAKSFIPGAKMTDTQRDDAMTRFMSGEQLDKNELQSLIQTIRAEQVQRSIDNGSVISGNFAKFLNLVTDPVSDALNLDALMTDPDALRQSIMALYPNSPSFPEFATGTNGFRDFGRGTHAILHGNEAVVPRNTEAGQLLDAFYERQGSSTDQTQLIQKIDQLNNNMKMAVHLLSEGLSVEKGIARNTKGSTNLYRSLGR